MGNNKKWVGLPSWSGESYIYIKKEPRQGYWQTKC
jgi:hypothetical protein